jgi:hypothetical protein
MHAFPESSANYLGSILWSGPIHLTAELRRVQRGAEVVPVPGRGAARPRLYGCVQGCGAEYGPGQLVHLVQLVQARSGRCRAVGRCRQAGLAQGCNSAWPGAASAGPGRCSSWWRAPAGLCFSVCRWCRR